MTRKVVYNACYGGFSLSLEAQKMYLERKGHTPRLHIGKLSWDEHYFISEPWDFDEYEVERHDPDLVAVVEELGDKANGDCAKLRVEDIGSSLYRIDEYDGIETVVTQDTQEWM